ncbi:MAG TPA: hypothetical protein PKA91_13945 [Leptospiraceae bacterium]|nr:hypothetical protein [Leptospiraceae bacterium]HMW60749.1 hypothetical protein [Leptospiraceae bacterium]
MTLALEEIHIQFYLRGIEALFLSSIAVTLIDKSWRNVFSAALFLIPVVHAGLVIGCVWFPMICNAVGIFSGMASLLFAVAAVVLVGKLYVR